MHSRISSFIKLAAAMAVVVIGAGSTVAAQAAVQTSLVYADGKTYTMNAVTARTADSPGLEKAPPLWLMVFVPNAIPAGYTPQCDPCDHPNNPNLPAGGNFHDHLLTSAPGMGNNGTAGEYRGPWMVTITVFNPAFTHANASFQPITSDGQLAAVEEESATALRLHLVPELLPINPNGPNIFERSTGTILICPIVGR